MEIPFRQKYTVLTISVGLTALLLGVLAGAGVMFRTFSEKLGDVDFLRERLKSLEPPSGPAQAKPVLVRLGRAVEKPVQPNRTLVGRLVEVRRVIASSEVSGKIIEFPLEEGHPVQAGKTVLARIDDIWARLALEQQQAQWLSTSAQLEFEQGELRRLEELFKAAAVTESELHQKRTQIAQLEAKLQELQAAMAQEQERQKRSVVYAPFDGVVVAKHAELGQYVQPGAPLVEIISRGQIDAQLMVPESAINRLQLDQTISILVDPLGEEVQGRVVSLTPFGPTASRTFPVRVRIDDPTGRLKVGMSITARIPTGPERMALVVPKDAVLEKPDEAVVWVMVPEEASVRGPEGQTSGAVVSRGQTPIRVEDVAQVTLVLEKRVYFNQCKGRPSMSLFIKREIGANVLEVMKQVRRMLEELNGPGGPLQSFKHDRYKIRLRLVSDDTYYIYQALGVVRDNLLLGSLLAIGVLWLFLQSFRPTAIIALAIPISVVGTFVVVAGAGRNVNIISLAGLAFAAGMVVDNAIVVLENIDRHMAMHESAPLAAYRGTKEVWGAILASTLTTVAVFGPVLTIQEETGQLFYDLALAISAAVLLSLVVSVIVIPPAAARFIRPEQPSGLLSRMVHSLFGLAPLLQWVVHGFARLIYLLCWPSWAGVWLRVLIVALFTVGSIALAWMWMLPASYLPEGNKNFIFALMFNPPSYSVEQNSRIGQQLEQTLRPYWEARSTEEATAIGPVVDPQTGQPIPKVPPIDEYFFVVVRGRLFMIATSKDPENVRPLKAVLAQAMSRIPGTYGMASQRSIFGRNVGSSNSVEVEVVGTNLERLKTSAAYLQQKLFGAFSRFAVRSDPLNFNEAGPERQIFIDQIRAKQLGLDVQSLAIAARSMIDGAKVGEFNFEGENIDLVIIRDPALPLSPDQWDELPLAVREETGRTVVVPLGELVQGKPAEASQSIRRVEQMRAITFTVQPPPEMALEEAEALIADLVAQARAEGGISSDVQVRMAGNADKLTQVRRALLGQWTGWNWDSLFSVGLSRFFLALVITYLLMAALFESFLYPLVIMFSVPLAMVGGFVGLRLVRLVDPTQQLDTITMLGFVILIGIVVNNAILLVHQALNFMRGIGESEEDVREPLPPREAIRESVRTRIRPIFMTATTTLFGMTPLVVAPGAGSELYRGLGAVVVGGLTCSTIFTLVVVPLLFSLMLDAQMALGRVVARRGGQPAPAPMPTAPAGQLARLGSTPASSEMPTGMVPSEALGGMGPPGAIPALFFSPASKTLVPEAGGPASSVSLLSEMARSENGPEPPLADQLAPSETPPVRAPVPPDARHTP